MFNLDKFISDSVTFRPVSMFAADIEANKDTLTNEIEGKSVCVIGGAGSIGSNFIKSILRFKPGSVVVIDLNENGIAGVREYEYDAVCNDLDELKQTSLNFDNMQTVKKMKEIVPEFKSKHSIYEQLDSKNQE